MHKVFAHRVMVEKSGEVRMSHRRHQANQHKNYHRIRGPVANHCPQHGREIGLASARNEDTAPNLAQTRNNQVESVSAENTHT